MDDSEMARHAFVCGYPRSGSTMFYNMLRTTVTNFAFLEREMPARAVLARPEDYVTKRPLDIFDIDSILSANVLKKRLFAIILIRDIRSVVTSRHRNVPDDYFIGFDHQYFVQDGTATFTNPGVIQTHNAIASTWQRRDLAKIIVRYEDILRDGEAVQSKLGGAIGFAYSGSFADFHKHETPPALEYQLNTRRAPDLATIEAWRAPAHRQRIRDQFTRCPQLLELLKIYGYEKDDAWFEPYGGDS
jgi:hypothetical protein